MSDPRLGASDTDPEINRILLEENRRRTPQQRLQQVFELNKTVEMMALAGIRQRHGTDLPAREEQLRLAALRLDREIMVEVFGWDPKVEGY